MVLRLLLQHVLVLNSSDYFSTVNPFFFFVSLTFGLTGLRVFKSSIYFLINGVFSNSFLESMASVRTWCNLNIFYLYKRK